MPQTSSAQPSVVRAQLGALLTRLREDAELKQHQAASQAGIDPGTLSKIESGLRGLAAPTAQRILDCYGVTDETVRTEVLDLMRLDAGQRRRPAWWKRHHEVLSPTGLDGYLALEATATMISNYEPRLIPGLLQTKEYARTVIAATRPDLTDTQTTRLTEVRLARQRKLLASRVAENDFHLRALIDEAVLDLPFADEATTRRQIEHLIDSCDHPRVSLRINPRSAAFHPGLTGAFVVMTLPPPAHDVVCVEIMRRSLYIENEEDIAQYRGAFATLWEQATPTPSTRTYLINKLKELTA
ncbi:helix-turn-helix domain-containing protein [Streptomyces sp. NPDC001889]